MRAVAILAPVPNNNEPTLKDKDGGDGENDLTQIIIDVAANGYMVTLMFEDGTDAKSVYTDFDEMMKEIRSAH